MEPSTAFPRSTLPTAYDFALYPSLPDTNLPHCVLSLGVLHCIPAAFLSCIPETLSCFGRLHHALSCCATLLPEPPARNLKIYQTERTSLELFPMKDDHDLHTNCPWHPTTTEAATFSEAEHCNDLVLFCFLHSTVSLSSER